MKICQFWIGIVGLALVTSGCISEILVPPLEFEREYVISGRLTDSLDVQEVLVMYTHGVGQNVPEFAEAVRVTLIDGSGREYPYREAETGTWRMGSFAGRQGETYRLEVELPDGRIIESASQTMPARVPLDSLYFKTSRVEQLTSYGIGVERSYVDVFANFSIPDQSPKPFLRWDVDEVFMVPDIPQPWNPFDEFNVCFFYRKTPAEIINLVDATNLEPGPVQGLQVSRTLLDWTFWDRHCFNVYQLSTSEEALRYWEKASGLVFQTGSIFDIQPGRLQGNLKMRNEPLTPVYGFFEVAAQSLARVNTYRQLLGPYFPKPLCAQDQIYGLYGLEDYCYDCRLIEGATLNRPIYW
jgi:hypothetical protein